MININEVRKIAITEAQKKQVREELSKHFTQFDEQLTAILDSLELGIGAYFYGKGGHGKTTVLEAVLRALKIPYINTTFMNGLAGAFNNQTLPVTESSAIEDLLTVRLDKLLDPKLRVVIVSELPDAPINVLEEFKDIGESGFYAGLPEGKGGSPGDIKVLFMATGNYSPKQILDKYKDSEKATSVKAALDRFPYKINVEWKNKDNIAFFNQLKLKPELNNKVGQLASNALALIAKSMDVSPRNLRDITTVLVPSIKNGNIDIPLLKSRLINLDMDSILAEEFVKELSVAATLDKNEEKLIELDLLIKQVTKSISNSNISIYEKSAILKDLYHTIMTARHKGKVNDRIQSELHDMAKSIESKVQLLDREINDSVRKVTGEMTRKIDNLFS